MLAQGTGQALATAAHGDADLVLVHDPEAEQRFVANGDGVDRKQIAWNDFVIVGPRADPAHIRGGMQPPPCRRSLLPGRHLSRAATRAALTLSNIVYGG